MNKRLIILLANISNVVILALVYKLFGFEIMVIVGFVMVMAYLVHRDVKEKRK